MRSTTVSQFVRAPREQVYRALIDADAVAKWKMPDNMSCQVHSFEPRAGGAIRISLTHQAPGGAGKTTARTDAYHGRFVELVEDERVGEVDEFETADPALQGEMRVTITLSDADGGVEVMGVHEGLPPGLSSADNEAGWRMALRKLAALVEGCISD